MARRVCPECKEPLQAPFIACDSCTWTETKGAAKAPRAVDPMRLVCCHEFQGQRCASIGTLALTVHGFSGHDGNSDQHWYCFKHYPPFAGLAFREALKPKDAFGSMSLTEQQWYNVCKWFPSIARSCKRTFADVGPHNSLDRTSTSGPLMGRLSAGATAGISYDSEAIAERKAIQGESRQGG